MFDFAEQPKKKNRRAGGGRNWFAGWSFLAHHGGDAPLGSLGEAGHGGHGVGAIFLGPRDQ